jgi:homopolymeric O-antigen transport system permease protein
VLRRLWKHRDLVLILAKAQYQLRYRQSAMGLVWAFLAPLSTLGAGVLIFHRVVGLQSGSHSYALVTMAGLVPWTFFATSLTFGVSTVAAQGPIVTRLAFPRAALPISLVGTCLIDLAVSTGIFLLLAFTLGGGLPLTAFWYFPLIVIEVALVSGLTLWVSAVNVFARDLRSAVPLGIQLWLFVTPVMYPLASVPANLRRWFLLNPMTGLVETFRRVLVQGAAPTMDLLAPALLGAGVLLAIGTWYFAQTEPRFADAI